MKGFRKIIINIVAILLVIVSCVGMTACTKDIRELTLTISVYNYDEDAPANETVTLKVDLYGHLAPNTVDAIQQYVNEGYYNNTAIYKLVDSANSFGGLMVGDIKIDGENLKANAVKPEIKGEFEKGGTVGSNLTAKKGSIGLFRSWFDYDDSFAVSNSAMHSGRATWFIPTADSELSSYNGWFCIFAQFDVEDEDNAYALDLILNAFDSEDYAEYVVYYTGEYDANKADEDYGLEKHIVLASDFEDSDAVFEAEGEQLVSYNKQTIKVPTNENAFALKIVKAEVK